MTETRKEVYHAVPTAERRERWLQATYGLSAEQYGHFNVAQNGRCAICKRPRPLHVDHDHVTDGVRGLLCGSCNRGIGLLGDDPENCLEAGAYLLGAQSA